MCQCYWNLWSADGPGRPADLKLNQDRRAVCHLLWVFQAHSQNYPLTRFCSELGDTNDAYDFINASSQRAAAEG